MTANQINARKVEEDRRHNAYQEQLTLSQIREDVRHNLKTEKEQARHNMQVEAVSRQQNYETQRHNIAGERLTETYNSGNLLIGAKQAQAALRNADTNAINAQTNRYGYELQKMYAPYNIAETQSKTQLNTVTTEMKPYETGVRLVDSFINAISVMKPRKGK